MARNYNCSRNCKVYIDIKRSCWKRNPFIKQTSSIFRVPCQWGNMYMLHCYTWENLASCNTCYMCSKKSHNIVTFRIMPFSFYAFCLGEVFTDINGKATDQVTIYIYTWLCLFFCESPTFWCVWCTFGRCLILVNQLQRRRLNPTVCWQTTKVESFVETNTSTGMGHHFFRGLFCVETTTSYSGTTSPLPSTFEKKITFNIHFSPWEVAVPWTRTLPTLCQRSCVALPFKAMKPVVFGEGFVTLSFFSEKISWSQWFMRWIFFWMQHVYNTWTFVRINLKMRLFGKSTMCTVYFLLAFIGRVPPWVFKL